MQLCTQEPVLIAAELDTDGLILLSDLRPFVPLHPQHLRKLARRGEFPTPIKVGGRTMFRRREIRDWLRKQGAQ